MAILTSPGEALLCHHSRTYTRSNTHSFMTEKKCSQISSNIFSYEWNQQSWGSPFTHTLNPIHAPTKPVHVLRSDLHCLIGELGNDSFGFDVFVSPCLYSKRWPKVKLTTQLAFWKRGINITGEKGTNAMTCSEHAQQAELVGGGNFNSIKDNLGFLYCVLLIWSELFSMLDEWESDFEKTVFIHQISWSEL